MSDPDSPSEKTARNRNFDVSSFLQNNNIIELIIAVCKPKKDGSDAKLVKPLDAEDFANSKLEYTCSQRKIEEYKQVTK